MAHLFRAISAAERVHALRHLRLLKMIRSTEENLKAAFESESTVSENIYPELIRVADAEGNAPARIAFSHARDAEEFHAKLYKNALEHMMEERQSSYHVCSVCGYVAEGEPPEQCPICGARREMFQRVD
jgi:rubrerythrin